MQFIYLLLYSGFCFFTASNVVDQSNDPTYRLEKTLEYGLERVWTVAYMKGSSKVVFGCDKGTIVAKISSSLGSDSAIV
ncbi:hypothetical protein SCA6_019472 [Theobroma cacao]